MCADQLGFNLTQNTAGAALPRCAHGRTYLESCPFCDPLPSTMHTRAAAELAIKPTAANLREQVYACIKAHPQGITDEQIAALTKLNPNTARPRRLELERAGRITASGTSRTRSGRKAVCWVVSATQDSS